MERVGLGLQDLRTAQPSLVTCSLTAFGPGAPETASRPGYDIIVQALSGLMSVTGERDGEPTKAGVALLDVITGLYAAVGVLAALRERDVTGRGRHVSVALFDASVAAMVNQAANYLIGGVVPERMGTAHPNIVPYQAFHASDRPFILAAGNDRLFARTCQVVEHEGWADDPRFATNEGRVVHRDELTPLLQEVFARRPMQEWLSLLEQAGVPCSPIMSMDEVFASDDGAELIEQIEDPVRGLIRTVASPIRFDGVAPATRTSPPLLGEHDVEVRRDLDGGTDA
jgi:crotonobetainyl-CoA:carnitine CoA-transferase CaiB-like acyl-CoA transferase